MESAGSSSHLATLEFSRNQLWADGNGLQAFTDAGTKVNGLKTRIEADERTCKCQGVVLGLLALIAAAGAGVLLAFSGGPTNLLPFVSGCVLGGIALSLTILVVVMIVKSIKFRKEENEKLVKLSNATVNEQKLLEAMHAEGVTSKQIKFAMDSFPEKRKEFMEYVLVQYYADDKGKEEREDEPVGFKVDTRVLEAFAQFPEDVAELKVKLNQEFATFVLANQDLPAKVKEMKVEGLKLLATLFKAVESDPKSLANHPEAVAQLAQALPQQFKAEVVVAIYGHMTLEQQTVFLKQMDDDIAKLENSEEDKKQKEHITQLVYHCIATSLTSEFAKNFKNEESEKNKQDLLTQIIRWPNLAARCVYIDNKLETSPVLINALYAGMDGNQKSRFVEYAAHKLNEIDPKRSRHAGVINAYAQSKVQLPEATRQIYAKTPLAMLAAMGHLDKESGALQIAESIKEYMSSDDKLRFVTKTDIAATLLKLKTEHNIMDLGLAVAYFTQHPKAFTELVLKEVKLGADKERSNLALSILEKMDKDAEQVIQSLDEHSVVSHAYFNYLTNTLIDEVKGLNPQTNSVSDARDKLIARFKYAPQIVEAAKGTFKGKQWKLRAQGADWNIFNQIALTQKDNVWKKEEPPKEKEEETK